MLTVGAQFFLLIIFVISFEELNYIGIIANLFVSPLVEFLTIGFLCLVMISFLLDIFTCFQSLIFFKHFLSLLLFEIVFIFEKILNLINKIPYKTVAVKDNKDLFIAIIIIFNFLTILCLEINRLNSLKKEKYRIIK